MSYTFGGWKINLEKRRTSSSKFVEGRTRFGKTKEGGSGFCSVFRFGMAQDDTSVGRDNDHNRKRIFSYENREKFQSYTRGNNCDFRHDKHRNRGHGGFDRSRGFGSSSISRYADKSNQGHRGRNRSLQYRYSMNWYCFYNQNQLNTNFIRREGQDRSRDRFSGNRGERNKSRAYHRNDRFV